MNHSILFFLRSYNDIDHITPLIWKVLDNKSSAYVIFSDDYDFKSDYRIQYLKKFSNFKMFNFPIAYKKSFYSKVLRELIYSKYFCYYFLKKHKIKSAVFEWSEIYSRGLIGNFFKALKKLKINTFSIPHGCSIYLDILVEKSMVELYNKKGMLPDFSNRNIFDNYIYQSPFHLKNNLKLGHDPEKTFAWGSLRFDPFWAKKNLEMIPSFKIKNSTKKEIKIVFMLPHWNYNVKKELSLDLIERLIMLENIFLVIKDHTRGSGGLSKSKKKKYNAYTNVIASVDSHSPALISWSDIVINFGSSIGIEVLLQNKCLINPVYLHTNRTIFEKTKACYIANNKNDVLEIITDFKDKKLNQIPIKNKNKLYKEIIYGGRSKFDVLDYYHEKIVL